MGFEPTTFRDLVGCSSHWTTGNSMVSKGQFVGLDWNRITRLHSQVRVLVSSLLSQKNMTGYNVVCKNWQLSGKKQDLGTFYPMGFFTKFPTSTPVLFIWESPRGADILRYQVTDRLISPWVFWLKTNWRLISGRSVPKGYYLFKPVKVCTRQ